MAQNTNTLEQTPTDDGFEDILAIQKRQEAEDTRRIAESAQRILTAEPLDSPVSKEGTPIKQRLLKTGAGLALIATGVAGGVALGSQNERALNDSKETVATDVITPSQEQGDLIGPAAESVSALLEENGYDPNSISYETIQTEVSQASAANAEATGSNTIQAGAQFEVTLNTATGGILTGGAKTHSIDITSVAADNKEETQ